MEKKTVSIKISDKDDDVKYIEQSAEEGLGKKRRDRTIEEFVRIQETSKDGWRSKHNYLLCLVLIGTSNDLFPFLVRYAAHGSGGCFIFLSIVTTLVMALPLVYMETFLGRYSKLTNCQMYRMAPIFFGASLAVFIMNVFYQPFHAVEETQLLVNLLKLLVNPDINMKCIKKDPECYDYKILGALVNDTCEYGFISMICSHAGEIRYPMEYQYWKMYKDPESELYPYWQIIIGVVVTWGVIMVIVIKGVYYIGSLLNISFIIHMSSLLVIFILALTQKGSMIGLHAMTSYDISLLNFHDSIEVMWFSLARIGLIIPTGFMTYSACAKFKSNIATDSFLFIISSLTLSAIYLCVFFAVSGVLAEAMGVSVDCVVAPYRGLYLAMIPEVLVMLQIPNIFLIIFYSSLWFLETNKIALYVHMLILNLFDYFPNTRNFATYIWVSSCLFLCFISIPMCTQYATTVTMPIIFVVCITIGAAVALAVLSTMISIVYGVTRFCDDIHFATGIRPMRFWRVMWFSIPLILWFSILLTLVNGRQSLLKKDFDLLQYYYGGSLYEFVYCYSILAIGILSSIMHIIFRFGTPNLFITLLKPQFFWGPPERHIRIARKNFCPHENISSQQIPMRDDPEAKENKLVAEFSKEILREHLSKKGGVSHDHMFFQNIGLTSAHKSTNQVAHRFEEDKRKQWLDY